MIHKASHSPALADRPKAGATILTPPKQRRSVLAAYALMIGAWMFDFRSKGAGQGLAVQGILMLAFISGFGLILLYQPRNRLRVRGLAPFLAAVLLFILVPVFSGLVRGQEAYPIFRNSFSVLTYAGAAYATATIAASCPLMTLRRILGWLSAGFSLSSFLIVAVFGGGVDVETSRYEIQGSSSIACLALILLAPVYPLRRIEILAAVSNTVIVFLTVTRTYLVVFAAQALALLPAIRRLFRLRTLLVLAAGTAFAAITLINGSNVAQRWHDRLFVSDNFGGVDPTYVSRASEWEYMWRATMESPDQTLIGSGFAAETKYYLDKSLGGGGESGSSGFGHNQHLSLLFIGGLMGGAPLLVLQFVQGWWALRLIRPLLRIGRTQPDLAFLGSWGALIVIGTLASNFFSSSFGSRGFALWYGIGTGLLLGARTLSRRKNQGN